MKPTMCRRFVRLMAGPVVVAGVIGGAMGMSAIAHMNAAPTATTPASQLGAPASSIFGAR
jgi:hypothetical protein